MPQMGESIAEGTVSRWLKRVGDEVKRDEAILEISTDKVDAEIPSPTAGVLAEIKVEEGQTVEVQTVVAIIETEKGAAAAAPAKQEEAVAAAPVAASPPEPAPAAAAPAPVAEPPGGDGKGLAETEDERLRHRSTPLVRRIAAEHGVDISGIQGSGHSGRVTKKDILAFIEPPPPRARSSIRRWKPGPATRSCR
jgi:2-oxoglutarate dehydrogenase E2 component (dihydrolipoamide succinyltransferase)